MKKILGTCWKTFVFMSMLKNRCLLPKIAMFFWDIHILPWVWSSWSWFPAKNSEYFGFEPFEFPLNYLRSDSSSSRRRTYWHVTAQVPLSIGDFYFLNQLESYQLHMTDNLRWLLEANLERHSHPSYTQCCNTQISLSQSRQHWWVTMMKLCMPVVRS